MGLGERMVDYRVPNQSDISKHYVLYKGGGSFALSVSMRCLYRYYPYFN